MEDFMATKQGFLSYETKSKHLDQNEVNAGLFREIKGIFIHSNQHLTLIFQKAGNLFGGNC